MGSASSCRYVYSDHSPKSSNAPQIVEDEHSRATDFYDQLNRIQFQAARVSENQAFNIHPQTKRSFMREKATALITAIVKFFNSALLYFCHGTFGRLSLYNMAKL